MSIKVTSAVWENSQSKGGHLLVLLAIADFADDNGVAFPSIATLSRKSRLSERQIHYALDQLQASGELTISRNAGPYRANLYRVQILQGANIAGCSPLRSEGAICAGEGAVDCTQRVQSSAGGNRQGTVILEPSREPSESVGEFSENSPHAPTPSPVPEPDGVSLEFRARMRELHRDVLGAEVDGRIDEALGHVSVLKFKPGGSRERRVARWLQDDAAKLTARPRASPNGREPPQGDHVEDYRRRRGHLPWEGPNHDTTEAESVEPGDA